MRKALSDTRNSGEYLKKKFRLIGLGAMENRTRTLIRMDKFCKTIGGTLLNCRKQGENQYFP
jgi:hypothetical protein